MPIFIAIAGRNRQVGILAKGEISLNEATPGPCGEGRERAHKKRRMISGGKA